MHKERIFSLFPGLSSSVSENSNVRTDTYMKIGWPFLHSKK